MNGRIEKMQVTDRENEQPLIRTKIVEEKAGRMHFEYII
jgi:hypothetical protein